MKQFVVIGLGRFGMSVATELYKMGHEVLAVDNNMERVEAVADSVRHTGRGYGCPWRGTWRWCPSALTCRRAFW